MERGICPIAPLTLRLTLYSLTGSRVWRLESRDVISQMVLSYWWSVDTKSLNLQYLARLPRYWASNISGSRP